MPIVMAMMIWKTFITMPRTVSGMSAPNSDCAPYFTNIELVAAIAMTSEICARKLHRPSGRNLPRMRPESPKSAFSNFKIFVRQRYQTLIPAVTSCPSTVAIAAPTTPPWNTKMAIGSPMTFVTAPASIQPIAKFGLLSARMIGLAACPKT